MRCCAPSNVVPHEPSVPTDGGARADAAQLTSVIERLAAAVGELSAALDAYRSGSALAATPASAPPAAQAASSSARAGAAFNLASFNTLGASHTAASGNKPSMASGATRTRGMVGTLRRNNVDVAGLQEFQGEQQAAFRRLAPEYDMWGDRDNVVTWRSDRFRKVSATTLTIPYFEGSPRKMPVVQLEDRRSGQRMWVINVHNPADTRDHPRNAANRAEAVRRERQLVAQLEATGVPVYLVGDFNDRAAESRVTAGTAIRAAAPSRQRAGIDWIFGSRGTTHLASTRDDSPRKTGVSDHPIVVARTQLS